MKDLPFNDDAGLVPQECLELFIPDGPPTRSPETRSVHRSEFNCYGYGLNLWRQGWVQPGALKDARSLPRGDNNTNDGLMQNLEDDGLIIADTQNCDFRSDHILPMIRNPDGGYHALRVNDDGTVTQKFGPWGISEIKKPTSLFRALVSGRKFDLDAMRPEDFVARPGQEFVCFAKIPVKGIIYDRRYRFDAANPESALEMGVDPAILKGLDERGGLMSGSAAHASRGSSDDRPSEEFPGLAMPDQS